MMDELNENEKARWEGFLMGIDYAAALERKGDSIVELSQEIERPPRPLLSFLINLANDNGIDLEIRFCKKAAGDLSEQGEDSDGDSDEEEDWILVCKPKTKRGKCLYFIERGESPNDYFVMNINQAASWDFEDDAEDSLRKADKLFKRSKYIKTHIPPQVVLME